MWTGTKVRALRHAEGRDAAAGTRCERVTMSESTEGYDPSTDPDADPDSLQPRTGAQAAGGGDDVDPQSDPGADPEADTDADPDADPDMLNPRSDDDG